MVVSVEFKGENKLGVNANGKFFVDTESNKIESIKNVPIVSYKKVNDIEFIKRNMEKFNLSCHVAFIDWDEANEKFIKELKDIGVAVFIRILLVESNGEILVSCPVEPFENWELIDRVVLVDGTTSMQITTLNDIKKSMATRTRKSANDIGVCGSPFSFGEDACLCAIWARKLMAKYTANTEVALPSANHECMEECGCIRKIVITSDVEAPAVKESAVKSKSISNDEDKTLKKVVKGVGFIRGRF